MSGRNQHYIPKSFQRPFCIDPKSDIGQIWCYRRGKKAAFPTNIDNVAAERDFYSTPSVTSKQSVDDIITEYETKHLTALLLTLRALRLDDEVPRDIACEVVAHLAFRGKYLRTMMSEGLTGLFVRISNLLSMGFDAREFPAAPIPDGIQTLLIEGIQKREDFGNFPVGMPALARLVYALGRENAGSLLSDAKVQLESVVDQLSRTKDDELRAVHAKSLTSLVPEGLLNSLNSFQWKIVQGPPEGAILPDCVGIASKDQKQFHPIIGFTKDANILIVPLSPEFLLLGTRNEVEKYNSLNYNLDAIRCSTEFFLANESRPDFIDLHLQMGEQFKNIMAEMLEGVAKKVSTKYAGSPFVKTVSAMNAVTKDADFSVSVVFSNRLSQRENNEILGQLAADVVEYLEKKHLCKLATIEFNSDPTQEARSYATETLNLEMQQISINARSDDFVAIIPTNSHVAGYRLIVNESVAEALLIGTKQEKNEAIAILKMVASDLDLSFILDDIELGRIESLDLIFLIPAIRSIRNFRRSLARPNKPTKVEVLEQQTLDTLRQLWDKNELLDIAERNADSNAAVAEILERMSASMEALAALAGFIHAGMANTELSVLKKPEFERWFNLFKTDLSILSEFMEDFEDSSVALIAARHLERLMYGCGFVFYTDDNGSLSYWHNEHLSQGMLRVPFESVLETWP